MERFHRKLQKISESYFINLPKRWIQKYGLEKKSTVTINLRSDGSLIITPKVKQEKVSSELTLDASKSVPREIVKNSLSGVETIRVISDKKISDSIRKEIKRFIDGLPNTEIIEESNQRMTIQNFGYKKVPTKKIIRRLLFLASNMFDDVKNNRLGELERNFHQLRKFYFILVTHIRTYLRTGIYVSEDRDFTPLEAMDYRMFCQKIEQIGVILKDLRINEQVSDFFLQIESYYNKTVDAFLKKDPDLAYDLWFERDEIVDQAKDIMNDLEYQDVDKLKDMVMIAHACKDMTALI